MIFLFFFYIIIAMYKRLKEVRKVLGLSQKDFSERLGLTQGSYSSIETGTVILTEKNIKLICMSFNVDKRWLQTGIGTMFTSQSPREGQFLEVFRELLPENQDYILASLNKLLETQQKLLSKT
ncbi:helix-turn-helix domain-containing protein [Breznakiellaceae bacterium SP9]